MLKKGTIFYCLSALIVVAMGAVAQEHPEHPEDKTAAQPEETYKVDTEAMAAAIKGYVAADADLKGGYFLIFDSKLKKPLALKLAKVHEERLAKVGENLYFACSDFTEAGGQVFDLDFFMEEVEGKLLVTKVLIHKEDDQPRYSWFEDNGLWKTKPTSN